MKKAFIIVSILCIGCQYKSAEKPGIIDEEIQVILNTFEIAVTAVRCLDCLTRNYNVVFVQQSA